MNELGWGVVYTVDHLVPLTSPLVCGLHVHCNLAVVAHLENSRKGNSIWPGMWPMDWGTLDLLLM
jgi:hypothetical protein